MIKLNFYEDGEFKTKNVDNITEEQIRITYPTFSDRRVKVLQTLLNNTDKPMIEWDYLHSKNRSKSLCNFYIADVIDNQSKILCLNRLFIELAQERDKKVKLREDDFSVEIPNPGYSPHIYLIEIALYSALEKILGVSNISLPEMKINQFYENYRVMI